MSFRKLTGVAMTKEVDWSGRHKKMFTVFRHVIESERQAQKMYREAISLSEDPAFRTVLEGFLGDAQRHERELVTRYNALRKQIGGEPEA